MIHEPAIAKLVADREILEFYYNKFVLNGNVSPNSKSALDNRVLVNSLNGSIFALKKLQKESTLK